MCCPTTLDALTSISALDERSVLFPIPEHDVFQLGKRVDGAHFTAFHHHNHNCNTCPRPVKWSFSAADLRKMTFFLVSIVWGFPKFSICSTLVRINIWEWTIFLFEWSEIIQFLTETLFRWLFDRKTVKNSRISLVVFKNGFNSKNSTSPMRIKTQIISPSWCHFSQNPNFFCKNAIITVCAEAKPYWKNCSILAANKDRVHISFVQT